MSYKAKDLKTLPTISAAHCCNLKVHDDGLRVWLCREGGGVSVEQYDERRGRWVVTDGSCYAPEAG
jgi:hypothetical protein